VTSFLLTCFRKAASHRAPSREFGGRLARMGDGSPPGLSRRDRNTPASTTRRPIPHADRRQHSSGPKNARCSGNAPRRPLPTIYAGRRTAGGCRTGVLRTCRDNSGVDSSTNRAKRPLNSRDGSRCDAAFQRNVSRKEVTLCAPNSTRRSRVKQWWY
jgi:hypothetical protein